MPLPPLDPALLDQNPGFAALYKDLTTRKMNEDASSREVKGRRLGEVGAVSFVFLWVFCFCRVCCAEEVLVFSPCFCFWVLCVLLERV
jgi:methylase of polypeptide subunit release factors